MLLQASKSQNMLIRIRSLTLYYPDSSKNDDRVSVVIAKSLFSYNSYKIKNSQDAETL